MFSALVTLVGLQTEQDRFEELLETVNNTRRISEFIWQWVPDGRTSDRKSPTSRGNGANLAHMFGPIFADRRTGIGRVGSAACSECKLWV